MMINQISRHVVTLVNVCLEFHLCVCVFKGVMYAVSFQQWHRGPHSLAELRVVAVFQFGGAEGLRLITTEMSVQPKRIMSVQSAVRVCVTLNRYRCIIQ